MDFTEKLKTKLEQFIDEIHQERWYGKERELINRFVFNHLINMVENGTDFYSPAQIAIEGRVKQNLHPGGNQKKEVCKDLVIWRQPNQTIWTGEEDPLIIIEWKFNKDGQLYEKDIEWLKDYTRSNMTTKGVAVSIGKDYTSRAVLISLGEVINENWINKSYE